MKQLFIWAALAAAMLMTSCAKEVSGDNDSLSAAGVAFRVLPEDTKTAFGPKGSDGKYPVLWTDDDTHLAINLNGENGFLDAARVQDEAVRFRLSGSLPTASSYTFYAVSPFAAAKGVSDAGSKGVCLNVELPASQTTLTTGPDAAAQLLYAVSDTFDEQPSGVDLSFGHIPAYLHLVFVNAALEGQVRSVSVSSDALNLAGRMNFYPQDGSFAADNMVKEITVATSQLDDVWCGVAPVDLSGKTLRFDIATGSGHTFKEVTFENGRALTAGKSILITFDMGSG
ncbi:MAG: fimbrillin family protein, partial [Bacteroidales bacterium]|nr:fimbrillin family protein [Bacteroidales bacterium]